MPERWRSKVYPWREYTHTAERENPEFQGGVRSHTETQIFFLYFRSRTSPRQQLNLLSGENIIEFLTAPR